MCAKKEKVRERFTPTTILLKAVSVEEKQPHANAWGCLAPVQKKQPSQTEQACKLQKFQAKSAAVCIRRPNSGLAKPHLDFIHLMLCAGAPAE